MKHKIFILFFFIGILNSYAQSSDDELINIKELIPDIVIDLKYNQLDNFLHQKVYTTDECFLSNNAARMLILVQDTLRKLGKCLKIFDAYRPRAAQFIMWEILPDPVYVANPLTGSNHNRGAAIDLTLIDINTGQELDMGTPFDWFGVEADINYINLPANVLQNRQLLRAMMEGVGKFKIYEAEWWHYNYNPALLNPLYDFQLK